MIRDIHKLKKKKRLKDNNGYILPCNIDLTNRVNSLSRIEGDMYKRDLIVYLIPYWTK